VLLLQEIPEMKRKYYNKKGIKSNIPIGSGEMQ